MRLATAFLALSLCAIQTGTAWGLDLIWSTGGRDLAASSSMACTLLVIGTGSGDPLPAEWRLVWSANGVGLRPLELSAETPQTGIAGVCEIRPASSATSVLARTDTAFHCANRPPDRAALARYVVRVEAGTVARIALAYRPPIAVAPVAAPADLGFSEVSLNGGGAFAYPPVIDRLQLSGTAGRAVFTVTGWFLDGVRSAELVLDDGSPIPVEITGRDHSFMTLIAAVPSAWRGGSLRLRGTDDAMGAITVPERLGPATPPWSSNRLLVRFQPGHAEPPANRTEGLSSQFHFSTPALAESLSAVGAVSLERLLPWFRHEDVNSTNLLGEPVRLEDLADLYVVHLGPGVEPERARERLRSAPQLQYATLDLSTGGAFAPDDPYFVSNLQWGLQNTGQTLCGFTGVPNVDIGATGAWDFSMGTSSVKFAILDTGIDNFHPDLTHAVLDTSFVPSTTPFDDAASGHGTAVTGIAAARGNDGFGVAGVAWNVTPVSIKVLNSSVGGLVSWLIQGIDRARVKGYPIVNMSLGIPAKWNDPPPAAADVAALNDICYNAFIAGNFLVAAAGNTGQGTPPSDPFVDPSFSAYPAAFSQRVLAVGAILSDGSRWRDYSVNPTYCTTHAGDCLGSNHGSWLDVLAPGGRFIVTARSSTPPDTFYHLRNCNLSSMTGTGFGSTSAAAPFVSGIAGLLKSFMPRLTGDDLEQIISLNTNYFGQEPPWDQWNGRGLVRGDFALNFIAPPKGVIQNYVMDTRPLAYLLVSDTAFIASRTFKNVPGLPATYTTSCWRIHLKGAAWYGGFTGLPKVWVRPSGTAGWRDTVLFDQSFEVPWGKVTSISIDSSKFETYVYRIPLPSGGEKYFPTIARDARVAFTAVGTNPTVGVAGSASTPGLELRTSPNPGRHGMHVDLSLPVTGLLRVSVIDVTGRHVAKVAEGVQDGGPVRLWWDARGRNGEPCRAGVYWCRVEFEGATATRRFVLLGR